jgi:hypothetical protein
MPVCTFVMTFPSNTVPCPPPEHDALAPHINAVRGGKRAAQPLADRIAGHLSDRSKGKEDAKLETPVRRTGSRNGVAVEFQPESPTHRQDSVAGKVVNACASDRDPEWSGGTVANSSRHEEEPGNRGRLPGLGARTVALG